jgi:hypothetical protein
VELLKGPQVTLLGKDVSSGDLKPLKVGICTLLFQGIARFSRKKAITLKSLLTRIFLAGELLSKLCFYLVFQTQLESKLRGKKDWDCGQVRHGAMFENLRGVSAWIPLQSSFGLCSFART